MTRLSPSRPSRAPEAGPLSPQSARRRAALASALDDDGSTVLALAVAVLRAWLVQADLDLFGVADPALLPVGTADRALLTVHEEVLGRPLEHTVRCPVCGELTTLLLGRVEVGEHTPMSAWCGPGIGVREPTYADLLAVKGNLEALLRRCLVGPGAGAVAGKALSEGLSAGLADLARIEGSLSGPLHSACIGCGAPLTMDVDVMGLVLLALRQVREDVDHEVHLLAAGYGWDLASIEALPDERRRRLAGLVAGTQP